MVLENVGSICWIGIKHTGLLRRNLTIRICDTLSDILRVCIGLFVYISSCSLPSQNVTDVHMESILLCSMFNFFTVIIYLGKKERKIVKGEA